MPLEAIFTLVGVVITCVTVIYQAGKLHEKVDAFGKKFEEHEKGDKREFDAVYTRVNNHGERIAGLEAAGE